MLLLSHFSRVRLCATPEMAAHQAPPSLGFSRQEWVAISFSNAWKWKVKVKSLSRIRLLATPWTAAYQAPPSMGFSRQEYWSGVPLPSPKDPIGSQGRLFKSQGLIWNRILSFLGLSGLFNLLIQQKIIENFLRARHCDSCPCGRDNQQVIR